jgi:hypothetical protein
MAQNWIVRNNLVLPGVAGHVVHDIAAGDQAEEELAGVLDCRLRDATEEEKGHAGDTSLGPGQKNNEEPTFAFSNFVVR